MSKLKNTLSQSWFTIQTSLFPWLSEELGELTDKQRELVTTLEMIRIEEFILSSHGYPRAFAEFSQSQLPERIHESLIKKYYQDEIVGHNSRDSTAIDAREKLLKKRKLKKLQKNEGDQEKAKNESKSLPDLKDKQQV